MRLRSCLCAARYRGAVTANSSLRLARLIIASLPSSSLRLDDSGGWYDSLMRQRFCQSKILREAIRIVDKRSIIRYSFYRYSFYMETMLPNRNEFTTHQQARAYGHELLRRNVVEAASHLLVEEGPE